MMIGQWRSLVHVLCLLPIVVVEGVHKLHRVVELSNESGQKLVIDWYNSSSGKTTEFSRLREGQSVSLNSFVNHSFSFRFSNDTSCGEGGSCPSTIITVNENENQVVHIKRGLQVDHGSKSDMGGDETSDVVEICRQNALDDIEYGYNEKAVMDELMHCIEEATVGLFERKREKMAFQEQLRLSVSRLAENYTCADNELPASTAIEMREWTHNGVVRPVHVLHEQQASKIHMLESFISPEECRAIEEAAKPLLHHGTVADGKGGSRLSDSRKAMQAGLRIPWEKEAEGDHIASVVRRLYDYTNHATGYNLTVEGQEDLMSIQYFGRGDNDTAPDRYTPHCDGDCDGSLHKTGGRVATMVMYCDVPARGGGTNFQNAGVYVKPKVGAAAFFAYHDVVTKKQETGFTTHSGCPVIEGTKRIAVQWMRIGVDKENPWDSFNTLNIKRSECDE